MYEIWSLGHKPFEGYTNPEVSCLHQYLMYMYDYYANANVNIGLAHLHQFSFTIQII